MSQLEEFSEYPLTAELTQRVVQYLALFRLFISLALAFAYIAGVLVQGLTFDNPALAATALTAYFVLAIYLYAEIRNDESSIYFVAQISLYVDVLLLALLLFIFGGLGSGLGVLLIFASATAAILLPLRTALFLASLATLTIIGESVLGGVIRSGQPENLVRSGLYGLTNFIAAVLAHVLAYWVRDYRLIAERQQ